MRLIPVTWNAGAALGDQRISINPDNIVFVQGVSPAETHVRLADGYTYVLRGPESDLIEQLHWLPPKAPE